MYRGKSAVFKFIQPIFSEYSYCRSVMKKYFNTNFNMSAEQNEKLEKSCICWICGGIIDIEYNKVRENNRVKSLVITEEVVIGVVILILM